jgi:ubiquinone/menaquinone biosynthesis C-methylase UbiE
VEEADLAGRRVLDVGCGTGRLAAALATRYGAKVWGVDPSEEMLAVAREQVPASVGLKAGRAEDLPFRDCWFERAVMVLVVHHVDRDRAFPELLRVLSQGGCLAISTPDPANFGEIWLSPLFPSYVEVERARFPAGEMLEEELSAAGFASTRLVRLSHLRTFSRERALEKLHGRFASTFALLSDEEYREGVARAERELPDPVSYRSEWLFVIADR